MSQKENIKPDDQAPPGSAWERVFDARTQMRASVAAGLLLVGWLIARHAAEWEHADVFAWASLAIGMVYGLRAAWESLRERVVDIDVLMVVGAGAAAAIGHAEEGATLLFLFVLAGALEELAMERTRREIEALHALMPTEAVVFREGAWTTCDLSDLRAGDRIRLRPGDRAPTDARVSVGSTAFDQSAITGESMPRGVAPGDDIYAGTINVDDPIEAVVSRPAVESSLSRILDLVTRAREQREPVQRTIDRLSQPYATGVMAVSAVLFVLWWTWLGRTWQDSMYTAITFLIVASPCALVIATPTATLAAIARAARGGVLFKGGQSIERLANVGAVCFDKTGTLTLGRPKLTQVHPVAWSSGEELLSIAAGLERDSTHPIATAVREAAQDRGIAPAEVHDFDHTTGRGMTGTVNGHRVSLGSYTHAERIIPVCLRGRVQEVLERIQGRGDLGVVVAQSRDVEAGDGQAAVLIMSDIVRPGAAEMVRRLHDLGIRPLRMLTGDNRLTAQRVASRLGLDRFDAELLPEDKVAAVRDTKAAMEGTGRRGRRLGVAVIGDGVNDAPALAASDIAIGIGSIGSDAALESADVVLLSDDLAAVPWAIELARRTRRKIRFNLSLALSIIFVMAMLTVIGSIVGRPVTLTLGVLAHEGGTLLVVLNSLLLLGVKPYAPSAVARTADDRRHADANARGTPAGATAANG
ncbi:MAG: cation-translocating P-type ATPase [Phycisphaeraceae bacterium]|nr:cation-translocating P-type ATPase [Phycisphaeraceae bacterium]